MSDSLEDSVVVLRSRADLADLVERLAADWRRSPEEWDNRDLGAFLDGMSLWLRDADGYYRNNASELDADVPSWRLFGDALLAGRVYDND
jgi:hypothetical protein